LISDFEKMSSFKNYDMLDTKVGSESEMMVVKRNGKKDNISFDKILKRLRTMGEMSPRLSGVVYTNLAMKVIEQLCNDITTSKIDELTAEQCHAMYSIHPDYNVLASRVIISCHHKNTMDSFSKVMKKLYDYKDKQGKSVPLVRKEVYWMVKHHAKELDKMCDYSRDFLLDYFGFKTLERSYLKSIQKIVVERPQHMWLRVSIGIHCTGLKAVEIENLNLMEEGGVWSKVRETYELMSQKYFTHATPTLYNAGTPLQQLSSCYLLQMESDSLDGIFNTLKECAQISKGGGGIGLNIHNIRATGSHIRGTDGYSNGIVPMLRVFNNTARYVDQCVHPETAIYTTSGVKRMCDCVVGETEIFGREGAVEVIQDVLEHSYSGEILEIQTMHSMEPLKITGQHPVYALCGQKKGLNFSLIENRLNEGICEFQWVDACELAVDDMLVYPIPTYSKDYVNITWEDCYMYGVILGDGSMNHSNDSSGYISLHTHNKKDVLEFAEKYFNSRMVEYSVKVDENITRIRWNRCVHLPFRYSDFYNEAKEKIVSGKWLNLPVEKSKYILKGLLDTDGCKGDELVFDTTSWYLMEACRFLCLKMGALTSGYIRDRVGQKHTSIHGDVIENKKISYCVRIPRISDICKLVGMDYSDNQFFKFMRVGGYLLSRIQTIGHSEYSGVLYDLQMNKEHNYLLSHGLVHNGGGKRKGSFAIYLEPWHADIELFLAMKRNQGNEELKARDLFYALWVPDLFMKRVKADGMWTLFCPDEAPGLSDVAGDEFEELYCRYETEGRGRKAVKAQEIWMSILDSQMETGNPYLLYKDSCNFKSNQKNLGVIKSSNLCCEVTQYTSSEETAVCNLASIALPSFIVESEDGALSYDYAKLRKVSRVITYNLNRVIDINEYPSEKSRKSNMRHRPIGLGVQGLADVFMRMGYAFTSEEAKDINRKIFESIYLGAIEESLALGDKYGCYESFTGSPASRGLLQFDLWDGGMDGCKGLMWRNEWLDLKTRLVVAGNNGRGGLRNSLLVAPMPTASTSQILGFNECFEPITSNFYVRKTLAGNFVIANRYLVQDLIHVGQWNERVKNSIIANNGSVQHLDLSMVEGGDKIKEKYRTVWEISMKHLIDMSADRGRFVCQSQSLNLWQEKATRASLTSMHFYAWGRGLKTGLYYLHTLAKAQTQQFSIEPTAVGAGGGDVVEEHGICENCSA
jgi:ribonucleoside-diphosphate reductase alpha subunit